MAKLDVAKAMRDLHRDVHPPIVARPLCSRWLRHMSLVPVPGCLYISVWGLFSRIFSMEGCAALQVVSSLRWTTQSRLQVRSPASPEAGGMPNLEIQVGTFLH